MKGIELQTILGIVLLVVIAVLLVSAFLIPTANAGQDVSKQKDFRWYCTFWARNGYQGTYFEIEGEGTVYMNSYCTRALGIPCSIPSDIHGGCLPTDGDPNWDKCRSMCRGTLTTG